MKKLIWAAMLPLAFAACTNEDIVTNDTPAVEGNMITLSKNFAIGVTKGDASSRAQYDGTFKGGVEWMPTISGSAIESVDKIGLSWIQGGDGKAYTNYEFEHYAWPVKDAATPNIDECSGSWKNLVFLTLDDFNDNGQETTTDFVSAWTVANGQVAPTTTKVPVETSGYFKTNNLSIFTGEYVIYAPYNSALNQVDYLRATAKEAYNLNAVKLTDEASKKNATSGLGNEVFYVGSAEIEGGATVNGFNLDPVTGFVTLNVALANNHAGSLSEKITKIAIFAEDGIVTEQAIDASKVKSNVKESLIADTEKISSSVLVNLNEAITVDKVAHTVFVPMLPQTIEDAKVVLFAADGSSLLLEVGDIEVGFGGFETVNATVAKGTDLQEEVYYVVDMETFASAMASAGLSNKATATINLLNDIEFDQNYVNANGLVEIVNNMTITGNDIIIPEGQALKVLLRQNNNATTQGNLTMNGKLIIEEGCCGKDAGKVTLVGTDVEKNAYVFNGDVTNDGTLKIGGVNTTVATFTANVENNSSIEVAATAVVDFADVANASDAIITLANKATVEVDNLDNDGTVTVNAYTKLTVAETLTNDGKLTINTSGSGVPSTDGTVEIASSATVANNGTINNYGVYNNNGSTTLNANSTFVDYVGSQYGVNMPTLVGNAEYICEVDGSANTKGNRFAYALGTEMKTTTVRFVENAQQNSKHYYMLSDYADYSKLASVKYVVNVPGKEVVFENDTEKTITFGTSLVVNEAKNVAFKNGATKVNGDITVNKGTLLNSVYGSASTRVGAKNLIMNAGTAFNVNALSGAKAATEKTKTSWVLDNITLNEATMTVASNAAMKVNGNMTISKKASATFGYSSYTKFGGTITNNGTFERVLSSANGSTANPAQVWCAGWTNNGTTVNAGPQVSK